MQWRRANGHNDDVRQIDGQCHHKTDAGRTMPFTQLNRPAAGQMEDGSISWSTTTMWLHYSVSKVEDGIPFFRYNDWGGISLTGHLLPVISPLNSRTKRRKEIPVCFPIAQRQGNSDPFPHWRRAGRKIERRSGRISRKRQKRRPSLQFHGPVD